MPKVSIIMPVYNKQDYLKKTLDSVLDQDFSDFELIVVDDGSTDQSPDILSEYQSKDKRIRIIHTENCGVSHARNVGLDNAKGEWIQFLDGDDLIEKEYLELCQTAISQYDLDIIFSSFRKIGEDGTVIDSVEIPINGIKNKKELQKSFFDFQLETGFYGFPSNKFFKKKLLNESGARFDENLKLAEDLDFFVQLYRVIDKAYYLPEISYSYLVTDENYLNRKSVDYLSQLDIQKRIRQWVIDTDVYNEYKGISDGSVCRYAAYAVFDAAQRGKSISSVCETLLHDETVCDCLKTDYVTNKVHKRIINLLQKKDIHKLENYLKTREALKKLMGSK